MPNPNDVERAGDEKVRAGKLMASAARTVTKKLSWSEWFGLGSDTWLGSAFSGYVTDLTLGTGRTGATWVASKALTLALSFVPGGGIFSAAGDFVLSSDVIGKKLEDMAKEQLPAAVQAGRDAIGNRLYGQGAGPDVVLNRPLGNDTLEATLKNLKDNCALVQDLLNKIGGKGGKAYYCDDAYQAAVLADKLELTKGEIKRDVELLRKFLEQLEKDLDGIDHKKIVDKVEDLAVAICKENDGRHWDNAYSFRTITRISKCSKEHCYGPK